MLQELWKPVATLIFTTLPTALADGGQNWARLLTQACYNNPNEQD